MHDLRVARLAPEDPGYSAGARWAVLSPVWDYSATGWVGLVCVKCRTLEEAVDLAKQGDARRLHRMDPPKLASTPVPLDTAEANLALYRQRRAAGKNPHPPASWSDVFRDAVTVSRPP
ncbi:hypothetical protein EOM89_06220 [Candidatus Falkowbacteria bacterium]|nr:hypothetical protein [Candidatus Falkowbacteria bacterium]